MRLIDADALLADFVRYVRTEPHMHYGDWDKMCISGTEIDDVVTNATTIAAEPVRHGRWVYGDDVDIQCSACGVDALNETGYSLQVKSNYCPNCGAKMDGGAEG